MALLAMCMPILPGKMDYVESYDVANKVYT